jgi:imidazolonepropionase
MMGDTPSFPSTKTLVRGARQLLTLRGPAGPRRGAALGELGIVPDGAVLLRGGKILEAGPSRRVENLALARGAHEIDATGRVVMPGFVDSRTQPVSALALPARRLEARAQSVLDGMARHGTTTVGASAGGGLDSSEVLAALRALNGLNGRPLDVIPDCHVAAPAGAEAICTELLPLLARRKLAQMVSVNCEALGELVARRILEQAHNLQFRTTVCAKASAACICLAIEVQAAAVVLHRLDSAGIPDLSLARPVCTFIPPNIHRRRLDGAPARVLLEAGAAVALASGFGFEHCPTYNMQMVISLACSEMGMLPAEAISAATINGAHALARGHLCGSLEPSKAADLLLLNIADYRELPAQFGVNHVHMVLKNGHVVYREGEVTSWSGQ